MKARVKGTTDIIDVEFDYGALNADYPPYRDREHAMFYQPEQLEWIDIEEKADPDYWEKLKHQYAGMAMQGILGNQTYTKNLLETSTSAKNARDIIVDASFYLATALVEKLKEKKK